MKVTIERTPERYEAPINGVKVPCQIYRGITSTGIPCDVYVLSIVPDEGYQEVFKFDAEAAGMLKTSEVMTVNVPLSRAEHIHRYGTEPPIGVPHRCGEVDCPLCVAADEAMRSVGWRE